MQKWKENLPKKIKQKNEISENNTLHFSRWKNIKGKYPPQLFEEKYE